MKYHGKSYKDIENNPNNIFFQNVFYVSDIIFVGISCITNEDHDGFATANINLAIRLKDNKSIMKLVYMTDLDNTQYKHIYPYSQSMPDRGVTDFCPIFVSISDAFVKDKDEYYIYTIDGRDKNNDTIYSLSFDSIGVIKVSHILNTVMNTITTGKKLTYYDLDIFNKIPNDKVTFVNIEFNNEFDIIDYYKPNKKLFDSFMSCMVLCHFEKGKRDYYFYITSLANSKDSKHIRETPYRNIQDLIDNYCTDPNSTYIIYRRVITTYYRKGANESANKIVLFGGSLDKEELICFEFNESNFSKFISKINKYLLS